MVGFCAFTFFSLPASYDFSSCLYQSLFPCFFQSQSNSVFQSMKPKINCWGNLASAAAEFTLMHMLWNPPSSMCIDMHTHIKMHGDVLKPVLQMTHFQPLWGMGLTSAHIQGTDGGLTSKGHDVVSSCHLHFWTHSLKHAPSHTTHSLTSLHLYQTLWKSDSDGFLSYKVSYH